MSWGFLKFMHEGLMLHLKCRPVHMHPGAVVVAEPLQVLLCVCSQDRALQLSVYCAIAEERKVEQTGTMKAPEETRGCCQFGNRAQSVVQNLSWEKSNIGSWPRVFCLSWSPQQLKDLTWIIPVIFYKNIIVILLPQFLQISALCDRLQRAFSPYGLTTQPVGLKVRSGDPLEFPSKKRNKLSFTINKKSVRMTGCTSILVPKFNNLKAKILTDMSI